MLEKEDKLSKFVNYSNLSLTSGDNNNIFLVTNGFDAKLKKYNIL